MLNDGASRCARCASRYKPARGSQGAVKKGHFAFRFGRDCVRTPGHMCLPARPLTIAAYARGVGQALFVRPRLPRHLTRTKRSRAPTTYRVASSARGQTSTAGNTATECIAAGQAPVQAACRELHAAGDQCERRRVLLNLCRSTRPDLSVLEHAWLAWSTWAAAQGWSSHQILVANMGGAGCKSIAAMSQGATLHSTTTYARATSWSALFIPPCGALAHSALTK